MPDKKRQENGATAKPAEQSRPHHVADEPVGEAGSLGATVQNPTTDSGLTVEEQIRKEWDPKQKGGLSTSLSTLLSPSLRTLRRDGARRGWR